MVDIAEFKDSKIHWMRLDDEAFAQELKLKFMEEAAEVCTATTKESLIEECADILEVMQSFADLHSFTLQDVIKVQNKKHQERGGFQGRKFVTIAEGRAGSYVADYCLKDPEKYPEIKD